jgi:hypothetical protein
MFRRTFTLVLVLMTAIAQVPLAAFASSATAPCHDGTVNRDAAQAEAMQGYEAHAGHHGALADTSDDATKNSVPPQGHHGCGSDCTCPAASGCAFALLSQSTAPAFGASRLRPDVGDVSDRALGRGPPPSPPPIAFLH